MLAVDIISMRPMESEVAGGAHTASLSLGLGPPAAVTAVAGNDRHVMVGGQAPYIRSAILHEIAVHACAGQLHGASSDLLLL